MYSILLAAVALGERAAYFLSGALIAAVPVTVFGALGLVLWRAYRQSVREDG